MPKSFNCIDAQVGPWAKEWATYHSFATFKVTKVRKPSENSFGKCKGKKQKSHWENPLLIKNKQKSN